MDNLITATDAEAVIYTKNNCSKCDDTKSLMDSLEVSYTLINMDDNPDAKVAIKKAGFRQAPVVFTKSSKWSGYDEGKIRSIKGTAAFLDDDSIWD